MSVDCRGYIGYTVTLKENLSHEDFDFFNKFEEEHSEYNRYHCKGKVVLVVDGMNGEYARLVFVDEKINECWIEGKDYFSLKKIGIPQDAYDELSKAYKLLYNKELDTKLVDYALWFNFA